VKDLIEALQILIKYDDSKYPTNCSHDYLVFSNIKWRDIDKEDRKKLKELGFHKDKEFEDDNDERCVGSFRYGSC